FGFAVFEDNDLLDWGIRRGRDVDAVARGLRVLATRYEPIVAMTTRLRRRRSGIRNSAGTNKQKNPRRLRQSGIKLVTFNRKQVDAYFTERGCRTKHERASMVARMFPTLQPYLPKPRRPWQHEQHLMPAFDAVAITLAADNVCPVDLAANS